MRTPKAALVLGAALLASALQAQSLADAARLAESRGAAIAAYDRAAWIATDAMLAAIPDPNAAGIRGYMVVPDGADHRAIFYGDGKRGHVPIYEARVREGAILASGLLPVADRRPLDSQTERFITARDAIQKLSFQRCNDASMNTVVLPMEDGNGTIVYLLTSQKDAGVFPAGGHHRMIVDMRGRVRDSRAFTKSCIDLTDRPGPNGERPVEFVLSHILDPQPTEIHVWLSRWSGKPVNVVTGDGRAWRVADGRIEDKGILPQRRTQ